jgi:hypothetical protein
MTAYDIHDSLYHGNPPCFAHWNDSEHCLKCPVLKPCLCVTTHKRIEKLQGEIHRQKMDVWFLIIMLVLFVVLFIVSVMT